MASHKDVGRGDAHAPGVIADYAEFTEAAAPGTPASGLVRMYTKTDGKAYIKDDAGTETDITGAGGGGADTWQAWSATLKGASGDPSVGNGTEVKRYIQYGTGSGSLILAKYYLEFGSTTTAGTGAWRIDGPVGPYAYDAGQGAMGSVQVYDSNTGDLYHGTVRYLGSPQDFDFWAGDDGNNQVNNASPITWATGDRFPISLEYEVA